MQATARRLSVVSATSCARRRLIRSVRLKTMSPDVPLRFLVGAARLIAVYFALRALDTSASVIIGYQMQINAVPALASKMPSIWAIYLPILATYLSLVLLTWFGAPAMCRLALRSRTPNADAASIEVSMNETMIFLVGVLMMGWGLATLGEDASRLFPSKTPGRVATSLDTYTQIRLFSTMALAGCGGMMMARFAAIYRWIQKRKQHDQQP
jgi:hypothetical protein